MSCGEVHGDKSTMYIRVTVTEGILIVLRLLCILYCGCLNWFCDVCVCVCVYVWIL